MLDADGARALLAGEGATPAGPEGEERVPARCLREDAYARLALFLAESCGALAGRLCALVGELGAGIPFELALRALRNANVPPKSRENLQNFGENFRRATRSKNCMHSACVR